jgi:hypothetical protein
MRLLALVQIAGAEPVLCGLNVVLRMRVTGYGIHQMPAGVRYYLTGHRSNIDSTDLHQQKVLNEPCVLPLFQDVHMSDVHACRP